MTGVNAMQVTTADRHALRSSELFSTQQDRYVDAILDYSSVIEVAAGTRLIIRGEVSKYLYCLVEGMAHADLPGPMYHFVPIPPPQVIGWGALVHPYRNLTNVSAITQSRVLCIPMASLQTLCITDNEFRAALMEQVAAIATRRISDILAELEGHEPYGSVAPS